MNSELKEQVYSELINEKSNQNNYKNNQSKKIGILYTKWNKKYIDYLVSGCEEKLNELGIKSANIVKMELPGSYDLLYGVTALMNKKINLNAIITIGILLKGETSHYEFLMNAIGSNLPKLQLHYSIPIINGILTCETEKQIIQRTVNVNHGKIWAQAIDDIINL
jgi:6,7-dimethyl-8-ribityllumazine synthase